MNRKCVFPILLILIILAAGCASIVSKSIYPVSIYSHPDSANITIEDEKGKIMYRGKTPTTISLSAGEAYFHGKKYTVNFSKEGYGEQNATIQSGLDGWYIGNILFGGLIGFLIVDPLTGAMFKLPNEVTVTLAEMERSEIDNKTLKIVTIDQIPRHLKQHLIRVN